MMRCAFIILLAFAVLSGGGNVITAEASAVATLTSTNFDELTSPGAWLLDFYAPVRLICGCARMILVWFFEAYFRICTVLLFSVFLRLLQLGSFLAFNVMQWCAHCKALEPIWEDVAAEVGDKVNFGKIDCTEHKGTLITTIHILSHNGLHLISGADDFRFTSPV